MRSASDRRPVEEVEGGRRVAGRGADGRHGGGHGEPEVEILPRLGDRLGLVGGLPCRRGPAAGEERLGEAGEGAGAEAFHPPLAVPVRHLGGEARGLAGVALRGGKGPTGRGGPPPPPAPRRWSCAGGAPPRAAGGRRRGPRRRGSSGPSAWRTAASRLRGAGGAGERFLLAAQPLRLGQVAEPLLELRPGGPAPRRRRAGSSPCRFISSACASAPVGLRQRPRGASAPRPRRPASRRRGPGRRSAGDPVRLLLELPGLAERAEPRQDQPLVAERPPLVDPVAGLAADREHLVEALAGRRRGRPAPAARCRWR